MSRELVDYRVGGLLALLHLSLQFSQSVDVAQCGAGSNVLDLRCVVLLGAAGLLSGSSSGLLLLTSGILEGTAVREDDALRILVELNHLERQGLTESGLRTVFLHQVLRSSEALNVLLKGHNGTLLEQFVDLTLVDGTNGVLSLEYIPRILLELLVAKAQTTVLLVDVEHDDVDLGAYLSEL